MAALALVLYVVMFLVVFVARSVIQKHSTGDSGIRAGVLGASPGSVEWVAGWLLVLALVAGFAAPIAEIAGIEPLTTDPWLRGAGIVVAGTGIVLTFLAQMSMGTQWRIGIDTDEQTGLVTDGAFGIVRNPIFSAMIVAGVGLALMVPNPISILGVVLLIAAIELQVRYVEEPHLRRLHNDAYTAYALRVGRFLPGIGRN
jgi:protein-S-isoprenylcysteine O-methyltransferase Ste14